MHGHHAKLTWRRPWLPTIDPKDEGRLGQRKWNMGGAGRWRRLRATEDGGWTVLGGGEDASGVKDFSGWLVEDDFLLRMRVLLKR
jgi:hypothetical protein